MPNLLPPLTTFERLKHLETVPADPATLAGIWRHLQQWAVFLLLASSTAFADPPKSLMVNGTQWKIVRQPEIILKSGWYQGYTSCDKHVIQIVDDLGRCFEAVTLFHELEHASVCNQDFESQQLSGHQAIDRLAFGMPKIMADNPKLRQYFGKSRNCSWTDAE
jgi:hypothetical protein